jgi:hypothetical protein
MTNRTNATLATRVVDDAWSVQMRNEQRVSA